MMFEMLLAKMAHEVSLLHLERKKKETTNVETITQSDGSRWSRSDLVYIWGCYRLMLFYVHVNINTCLHTTKTE